MGMAWREGWDEGMRVEPLGGISRQVASAYDQTQNI